LESRRSKTFRITCKSLSSTGRAVAIWNAFHPVPSTTATLRAHALPAAVVAFLTPDKVSLTLKNIE
jgi:hypothetical protein